MSPLLLALALAGPPGQRPSALVTVADGLPSDRIYAVMVAPDGTLFVGTRAGAARADGVSLHTLPGTENDAVVALGAWGGSIYLRSARGLTRWSEGVAKHWPLPTLGLYQANFYEDPNGVFWLVDERGLTPIGPDGPGQPLPDLPPLVTMLAEPGGALIGGPGGLYRRADGALTPLLPHPVRAIAEDPEGDVVVITEDGVYNLDAERIPLPCYGTGITRWEQGLLVTCGDGALVRSADGTWSRLTTEAGLPSPILRGAASDRDGHAWLGAWHHGLVRIAPGEVRRWGIDSMGAGPLTSLVHAAGGVVSTGWSGAWWLDEELEPWEIPDPPGDLEIDYFTATTAPGPDPDVVWLGASSGIWSLSPPRSVAGAAEPTGAVRRTAVPRLVDPRTAELLIQNRAGVVYAFAPGRVFIPGVPDEIPTPDTLVHDRPAALPDGLYFAGSPSIWRFADGKFDQQGAMPPGCQAGQLAAPATVLLALCPDGVWARENDGWTLHWEADGPIRALATRGAELWALSATALIRLSPRPLILDEHHGIPAFVAGDAASLVEHDGWLIAETNLGLLFVQPDTLHPPTRAPRPRIVAVEGRAGTLPSAARPDGTLQLSGLAPGDSFLRLILGSDWLGDPAEVAWRVKIDAGDWSPPVPEPSLPLALGPGRHVVEVTTRARGSVDATDTARVELEIPPFWWERADVRALVAALAIGGLGLIGLERHRRLGERLRSLQEEERIRQVFGRFVTPAVAEAALAGKLSATGELREVTVLFADIRDFTPLAEALDARTLVEVLNLWLDAAVTAIEGEGGVVNKFVGDAIIGLFGAPTAQPDHPDRALAAARRLVRATRALEPTLQARFGEKLCGRRIRIGVGINTGTVVAGPVGAMSRMEYTVIGEMVNVAARVEALTRSVNAEILITAATCTRLRHDSAGQSTIITPLGPHSLKGVRQPVEVFEVN